MNGIKRKGKDELLWDMNAKEMEEGKKDCLIESDYTGISTGAGKKKT